MKKKLLLLVPVLLLMAADVGHKWPELSIEAEKKRVELLGIDSTGPGNAAAAYAPYLTDEAPVLKSDAWDKAMDVDILGPENAADKEVVDKALEELEDELASLIKGSRRKDYEFWGKFMELDKEKDVISQPVPSYVNFLHLSKFMVARSQRLDKAGDYEGAKESLLAIGRTGNHFSRDYYLIGYMVGTALKSTAAKHLAKLEDSHGNKEAAAKWLLYKDLMDTRQKSYYKFTSYVTKAEEEEVKSLLLNEDVPFSFRFEALIWQHFCVEGGLTFNFNTLKCIVTDTPDWVLEIEEELASRDPLYKQYIDILRAQKPSDAISFREWLVAP